jgi:molybdate transport system substrate-binding protein
LRSWYRPFLAFGLGLAFATVLTAASAPARAEQVTVFAASSTTPALTEAAERYEASPAAEGDTIRLVFAASSTLAKQIIEGAPADLFLSANPAWMDYLADRDAIDPSSRHDLLGNRLALVAPKHRPFDLAVEPGFPLAEALDGGRLALGDPAHVPVGIYAKSALEQLGAWPALAARTARAADARAVLALVGRGEVAAGVVYQSDVQFDAGIGLVGLFPLESHPPIVYPLAVVASRGSPAVERLYRFLRSADAQVVFQRHGFRGPGEGDCQCRKSRRSKPKL